MCPSVLQSFSFSVRCSGITLLEVLIASSIGVVITGGAMLALTTSKKVSMRAAGVVEAAGFAQQTIERFRNKIACDDPDWFTAATCRAGAGLPTSWTNDPADSAVDGLPDSPGPLSMIGQGGRRQYRVTSLDCDGDGASGDCFQVDTKVAWSSRE